MNTKPDDAQILLWLEDELDSNESTRIEKWIMIHMPEQLQQRSLLRQWKEQLRLSQAGNDEIPYADFFQQRVMNAIETQPQVSSLPRITKKPTSSSIRRWLIPTTAIAACVALSFVAGRMIGTTSSSKLITYTPEEGVKAEYFEESPAEATVIVLNGVEELPDTLIEEKSTTTEALQQPSSERSIDTITP